MTRSSLIGTTSNEQKEMLADLGVSSRQELYDRFLPPDQQYHGDFEFVEKGTSEPEAKRFIEGLVSRNQSIDTAHSFMGAGRYSRTIPIAVSNIVMNGQFLTPYTPYQLEVSQGILETLFEFQSLYTDLSGMDIVNAGMYNGENALVEAALKACRITGKNKIVLSEAVNPIAAGNMLPYLKYRGIEVVYVPTKDGVTRPEDIERVVDDNTSSVVVQNPNFWGLLDGMTDNADVIHSKGALYIIYGGGDQTSLVGIKTPGECGADLYAGEGQNFGVPLYFGGPHVGVLGIKLLGDERPPRGNIRELPGRLVLQTTDIDGKTAYRLGLQPREQHIKRERATSNACTTATLISDMNVVYIVTMGPGGLEQVFELSYHNAHYLAKEIDGLNGYELVHPGKVFYNEFAVRTPKPADEIFRRAAEEGVYPGVAVKKTFPYRDFDDNVLLVAATEVNNVPGASQRLLEVLEKYAA